MAEHGTWSYPHRRPHRIRASVRSLLLAPGQRGRRGRGPRAEPSSTPAPRAWASTAPQTTRGASSGRRPSATMVREYTIRPLSLGDDPKVPRTPSPPLDEPPPKDTDETIKARYVFGVLGITGIAVLYALRVNLSVAIVTMVNHTALPEPPEPDNETLADTCPGKIQNSHTKLSGEFAWNEERQGLMLAAFFWGYAAGQLPGGLLAERFGGKLVFGLGVLLTALLTLASPLLLWTNEWLFVAARLLEGLFEGVTFPAIQFMIANWAPPSERSRFSMIFSGSYLGTVITLPVSGILCDSQLFGGWPLVFYATGAVGVLWYIPWLFCVYDTPAQHPRISQAERRYIESALGASSQKKKLPIPWKKIMTTPGLWACAAMHLGIGWNFFGQITYLPSYMGEILHYSIESNAALSAIPYILGGVSSLASTVILDSLISRKIVKPLTGFKIFNAMTGLGAAITLALLPLAGCNRLLINILLALNGISLGAQYAGNGTNLLVLAPNFAGTMYGISNTMANAAGILAPYAVGFLTYGNQTRSAWNIMFYISAAIGVLTFVIYWVLCSEEEEAWNNPLPLDEVTCGENNNKSNDEDSKDRYHENRAYEPDATYP